MLTSRHDQVFRIQNKATMATNYVYVAMGQVATTSLPRYSHFFFQLLSKFTITRFPVTRPPFYERVTVAHNERTIDPSSPTTTEWSALKFETVINEFDGFYHLMRK